MKCYKSPGGDIPELYDYLLNEPHLLIAGATGSGKSVLINSIIATALTAYPPGMIDFIFIDPKRVELAQLAKLPHCIGYANTHESAVTELKKAVDIMMKRYADMEKKGLKKHTGGHIYVVIDEYADLMITSKKAVEPLITRLVQLGRAANVHLIVATQRPTSEIIAGAVRVNLDCKIALHTATAQDSRNIITQTGAEKLPRFGYGYMLNPDGLQLIQIYNFADKLPDLIKYWTNKKQCIIKYHGKQKPPKPEKIPKPKKEKNKSDFSFSEWWRESSEEAAREVDEQMHIDCDIWDED